MISDNSKKYLFVVYAGIIGFSLVFGVASYLFSLGLYFLGMEYGISIKAAIFLTITYFIGFYLNTVVKNLDKKS